MELLRLARLNGRSGEDANAIWTLPRLVTDSVSLIAMSDGRTIGQRAMEQGVEIRVPWLDLELVRWSLVLPDSMLIRRQRAKWLPKELAARVISPQVAQRAKRGFAAPARRVGGARAPGSYGFRQGRYFALATSILERHAAITAEYPRAP